MSISNGVGVDIMLTGADPDMTDPEFYERVLEPAMARLKKGFVPDPKDTMVHMRISVRGVNELDFAEPEAI